MGDIEGKPLWERIPARPLTPPEWAAALPENYLTDFLGVFGYVDKKARLDEDFHLPDVEFSEVLLAGGSWHLLRLDDENDEWVRVTHLSGDGERSPNEAEAELVASGDVVIETATPKTSVVLIAERIYGDDEFYLTTPDDTETVVGYAPEVGHLIGVGEDEAGEVRRDLFEDAIADPVDPLGDAIDEAIRGAASEQAIATDGEDVRRAVMGEHPTISLDPRSPTGKQYISGRVTRGETNAAGEQVMIVIEPSDGSGSVAVFHPDAWGDFPGDGSDSAADDAVPPELSGERDPANERASFYGSTMSGGGGPHMDPAGPPATIEYQVPGAPDRVLVAEVDAAQVEVHDESEVMAALGGDFSVAERSRVEIVGPFEDAARTAAVMFGPGDMLAAWPGVEGNVSGLGSITPVYDRPMLGPGDEVLVAGACDPARIRTPAFDPQAELRPASDPWGDRSIGRAGFDSGPAERTFSNEDIGTKARDIEAKARRQAQARRGVSDPSPNYDDVSLPGPEFWTDEDEDVVEVEMQFDASGLDTDGLGVSADPGHEGKTTYKRLSDDLDTTGDLTVEVEDGIDGAEDPETVVERLRWLRDRVR